MAQTALSAYKSGIKARRSSGGHRKKTKTTIPLAIIAGFVTGATDVWRHGSDFGWIPKTGGSPGYAANSGVSTLMADFFGIASADYQAVFNTGAFTSQRLGRGLYQVLLGFAAHWGANKIGLNRMLSRMKVPLIRI